MGVIMGTAKRAVKKRVEKGNEQIEEIFYRR
jgi:hypothetical protein